MIKNKHHYEAYQRYVVRTVLKRFKTIQQLREWSKKKPRTGGGPKVSGSNHYKTHLTEKDIRYIRAHATIGRHDGSQKALAKKFKISRVTVNFIVHRRSWKHVP